jgi:translation initiation factor IF-3
MSNFYNVNDQIQSDRVNLVMTGGGMKENVSLFEAINYAENEGLDLVEVSPAGNGGLPVCKILDYGKMMYQQEKKRKVNKNIVHVKEIKYGLNIDSHDLQVKHKKILDFLGKKYKVRYIMELKGREKYKVEDALEKFNKNIAEFAEVAKWKDAQVNVGGNRASILTTLDPV